jgi:hypothetical protein
VETYVIAAKFQKDVDVPLVLVAALEADDVRMAHFAVNCDLAGHFLFCEGVLGRGFVDGLAGVSLERLPRDHFVAFAETALS